MKKVVTLIFGLAVALAALGQKTEPEQLKTNYPDSLVLSTDNGNEITFLFNRMSSNEKYFTSELWKSVISVMETAIQRSENQQGIRVHYEVSADENAQITVQPLEPSSDVFLIQKEGMKEILSTRVEFLVVQPEVAVSFAVNDGAELTEVKELDIESVWSQIEEKFDDHGKVNLYNGVGSIKYGTAKVSKIDVWKPQLDHLEITFIGIGLGYYRDQFIPDIGSRLTMKMHDRLGEEWMDFGVLYTQQYIYSREGENDFNMDLNGWLTGFWKIYAPNEYEFGIGLGGLIHRQGNFYENGTYKLSLFGAAAVAASRIQRSPRFSDRSTISTMAVPLSCDAGILANANNAASTQSSVGLLPGTTPTWVSAAPTMANRALMADRTPPFAVGPLQHLGRSPRQPDS